MNGQVELRLALCVGSVQEDEHERGIAHLVEHLCFRRTVDYKEMEIDEFLRSIGSTLGADSNAYTSFDETVYMLGAPTAKLEECLNVMSNFASKVLFEADGVKKESSIVLEEKRVRGESSGYRHFESSFAFRVGDSKYCERLPIGLASVIEKGDADVVRGFYQKWYRPENMALIVVGDLDRLPSEIATLIGQKVCLHEFARR